jgi:glycosyltransferase involved in cell wall biosynthesis
MSRPTVALVWNAPVRLVEITTRFEPYVEGLRANGVETLTVCPAGTEADYPYPVKTFTNDQELTDRRFWRELGCEAMAIITWHRMTDILAAARAAGLRTLAIGESDGQMSPRYHPWATFRFMTFLQPTPRLKLGAAKHWLQRFLFRAPAEHQSLVANTAATDVLTFAGQGAIAEFQALLGRVGETALAERVKWLPYPVPEAFCTGSVATERPERIIAVGRWDSPQKNGSLLAGVLQELGSRGARTEVLIVGKGSEERFGALARTRPTIRVFGVQPRERVRELMADCRAVLIPSRWESGPIVAWEMLALGGTVIGTPIPNLRAITADGRFGRVSTGHRVRPLADAIELEMAAWRRHERDPATIAAYWRPLVNPEGVGRRLLEFLQVQNKPVLEHLSV